MTASSTATPPPAPPCSPWNVTASRHVYDNAWIRVREDQLLLPDGREGVYGVVHFHNLALGAVPLLPDGSTVLVGQHRHAHDGAWSWELPEGGGDPARDPRLEMARELREETGLHGGRWTSLGELHTSYSVTDERGHLWLVEDPEEGPHDPDPTEVLRTWRLPFADAVAMARDGGLVDSLTVVGLLRAAHVLAARDQASRGCGASPSADPSTPKDPP